MNKQNPSRLERVCQSFNASLVSQNSTKRLRDDATEGASHRQVRVWLTQTYTDLCHCVYSFFFHECLFYFLRSGFVSAKLGYQIYASRLEDARCFCRTDCAPSRSSCDVATQSQTLPVVWSHTKRSNFKISRSPVDIGLISRFSDTWKRFTTQSRTKIDSDILFVR